MKKLLILIIFLSGCTSTASFTNPDGDVWYSTVSGNAEAKMKVDGEGKMEMAIKRSPIIETPSIDDIRIGDDN